jgi:hypothetical protein
MLSDIELQMLTAFVDGELSSRDRKRVTRLVQKSPTAQITLELLQADARRIHDLTRLKLGADFPEKVMRTLAQSGIRPQPARAPAAVSSPWIGMAIAASVFVIIAAASYWYFAPRRNISLQPSPVAAAPINGVFGPFTAAAMHITARDLGTETTRTALATTLHKDSAYHVDLAVQDNRRVVERVAATLKHNGIQVLMSPAAPGNDQQKKGKLTYFLFAENLKPDELASLLQQLGKPTGKREDAGVNRVIVDIMRPEHQQQLSALLGMAPGEASRDPLPDLVNKKIIAGAPAGQGALPKAHERLALVLASPHSDLTALGDSPELRTYLNTRREPQPGTLRVFLVIHESNA